MVTRLMRNNQMTSAGFLQDKFFVLRNTEFRMRFVKSNMPLLKRQNV